MVWSRLVIALCLAVILGVPFALRATTGHAPVSRDAKTLVIVTPHVQQIQNEFRDAFDAWYLRKYGEHVRIDWRTPGGTSEIIKQLKSQYIAAVKNKQFDFRDPKNPTAPAGTIGYDLVMGGGSFDHGDLKKGVTVNTAQGEAILPMSIAAGFTRDELDAWFGENKIGAQYLYDPDQFWIGTALSSFGIVYNRDVMKDLQLAEPTSFEDLCDPRLIGWIALADPRQSGSVTTTFDAILSYYGWEKGWRVLREMCANTRYFTNASTKPPIDVSQGEAAAGLAIDFYGRGQGQSVLKRGQDPATARVGYVDPRGAVYIDADPVSILRGGPNPELAKKFVEFCLTEEAQALWQFPARNNSRSMLNPTGESRQRLGPIANELRRLPVRRIMYAKYSVHMIDQVDPFELATDVKSKGWRSSLGIMMGAFAIDTASEQRAAWKALNRARRAASTGAFPATTVAEMERLFYAWPETIVDDKPVPFDEANYKVVRQSWTKPGAQDRAAIAYTAFFRRNYNEVVRLGASAQVASASGR